MATSQPDATGLRILTLDGGDLRAISQIDILTELMSRVEWVRGVTVLPCQFFDIIMGVGTGGVIAILLVVFRMNAQEAMNEFIQIYRAIFSDPRFTPSERSRVLEGAIYSLLDRKGLRRNMKLMDSYTSDNGCRVVIGAVAAANLDHFYKLRNYQYRELSPNVTVVEAIRATLAFPSLFDSVHIGPVGRAEEFVGIQYRFNNPTLEAIYDVKDSLGAEQPLAGVVSLGCGRPGVTSLSQVNNPNNQLQFLENMASNCDWTAADLERLLGPSTPYYRLSVDRGLERIENDPGTITAHTKRYLEDDPTSRYIDRCLAALDQAPSFTIGDLCHSPSKPKIKTWGLPPLSPSYVPRTSAMNFLFHYLILGSDGFRKVVVISGMPGVGKTQLVAKFAREYQDRLPNVVYVDASSEQTLRSGLRSRINALGFKCSTAEEAIDVLADWDEETHGRWFLIFDNADGPDFNVEQYFPRSDYGTILITTRDQSLGEYNPEGHFPLKPMSPDEAVKILSRLVLPPNSRPTSAQNEEISKIADMLGCLPAALVQAGCYIRTCRCLFDYVNQFEQSRQRILDHAMPRHLNQYDHSIYAVFRVTIEKLSKPARRFLTLLSCAHHTNFPRELITLAARHHFLLETFDLVDRTSEFDNVRVLLYKIICPSGEWSALSFNTMVENLQNASLISVDEDHEVVMFSMHPLLHAWAQDQLSNVKSGDGPREYRAAMARILSCGAGPEGASLHEYMISHIKAQKPYWKDLHVNDRASFADLLAFPGIADDSVEIWESVYDDVRQLDGVAADKILQVLSSLTHTYATQGDEKRSGMTQERVDELRDAISRGSFSRSRSGSTSAPLPTQPRATDITEAHTLPPQEVLIKRMVDSFIKDPDSFRKPAFPETPEFLDAIARVAYQYEQQHLYREAEVVGIEWFTHLTQTAGRFHPDSLVAAKYLAKMYSNMRRYKDASQYLELILEGTSSLNGGAHCETIMAKEQLACNYQAEGRHRDAESVRSELVNTLMRLPDPLSDDHLRIMGSLAVTYERIPLHDKATVLRQRVSRARMQALGSQTSNYRRLPVPPNNNSSNHPFGSPAVYNNSSNRPFGSSTV